MLDRIPQKPVRLLAGLLALGGLVVAIVACGGGADSGRSRSSTEATLVLDFIPGAVHAGVYVAKKAGYYEENGIDLRIVEPTSTADTLKLIDAGKADFGLADGIDLADQIERDRQAKAIMALLQRPAGGLVTLKEADIESPADLAGETIGVTGVPSDAAVLDTIMRDAGADPADADVVTIGFNGVQALEAGRVRAFTGYVPADAVQVENDGYPTRSFLLDENGGPSYPGLVAFSTGGRIGGAPKLMAGFVKATVKGYRDAMRSPGEAIEALVSQTQGIDRELATRSFAAWRPLMGSPETFGQFDRKGLEGLASFLIENDLSSRRIAPGRFATNRFAGGPVLAGDG